MWVGVLKKRHRFRNGMGSVRIEFRVVTAFRSGRVSDWNGVGSDRISGQRGFPHWMSFTSGRVLARDEFCFVLISFFGFVSDRFCFFWVFFCFVLVGSVFCFVFISFFGFVFFFVSHRSVFSVSFRIGFVFFGFFFHFGQFRFFVSFSSVFSVSFFFFFFCFVLVSFFNFSFDFLFRFDRFFSFVSDRLRSFQFFCFVWFWFQVFLFRFSPSFGSVLIFSVLCFVWWVSVRFQFFVSFWSLSFLFGLGFLFRFGRLFVSTFCSILIGFFSVSLRIGFNLLSFFCFVCSVSGFLFRFGRFFCFAFDFFFFFCFVLVGFGFNFFVSFWLLSFLFGFGIFCFDLVAFISVRFGFFVSFWLVFPVSFWFGVLTFSSFCIVLVWSVSIFLFRSGRFRFLYRHKQKV
ncbi:hypothetical protein HanRHA438_Chr06g0272711 [Helianthus annuus]|nr:hypothetical protein HanHA300_Chr06g0216101 [Helianthus annuus]KAJ0573895.1 hypothetical protein HanHA89_Chr06g0231911 [Helianthus annuus]KAJ0912300.1 hypothetical protein HanRHA438_Chr06g0272711 [Helianthus annuus]